jgi:ribonuclease BN (tRNA processing enzyme)
MVAEIIPMLKIDHIYVSHFHPEHQFGLQVLQHSFQPGSALRVVVYRFTPSTNRT